MSYQDLATIAYLVVHHIRSVVAGHTRIRAVRATYN